MDGSRFDDFARGLARSTSRRDLLRVSVAVTLSGLLGGRSKRATAAKCRDLDDICRNGTDCCTGRCGAKDRSGRQRCVCPPGTERCANRCVVPASAYLSDPKNCGACGHVCPSAPCNVGICVNGVCGLAPDPASLGRACDDGNPCTLNDICRSDGSCAGTPVVCTALDQCHDVGVCDSRTGVCSNPAKTNGSTCDDGNRCTQTDTCQDGVCVGGNPVVCTASDQCHDAGTCDPATGVCSNPAKSDGTSCSDDNACTQTDTCQSGVCTPGTDVVCDPPDQCHEAGICNPTTGECEYAPKQDGTLCDDGNACTQTDTCQAGVCVGGNPIVCTALDQCHEAGVCDPATGICSDPLKTDGAPCDDGNACTQTDTCQAGACMGSNPVICTASDQCHDVGTCDPATGQCSNPARANGYPCSDNNACTDTDTCQEGVCTPGTDIVCDPPDQCHEAGICNPTTGLCEYATKQDGTSCNDGNACTQTDTCQTGVCVGGNPITCPAADQCHEAGVCNPATGTCDYLPKTDGTSCDDGNACTVSTCVSGVCVAGSQISCDDGNACTIDSCDPSVGCLHVPRVCDDSNACTRDTCDPATGCVHTPIACDDGNPCTIDSCDPVTGCKHVAITCDAPGPCQENGICDAATGQCVYQSKQNGTPCDDGNACTRTDTCQDGVCVGGNPIVCTASDQCHDAGVCNPATGQCSNPAKSNGVSCNDGNPCTTNDRCQNGVCTGTQMICTLANATSTCSAGICVMTGCNSGYANCNGVDSDGCETNLMSSSNHCGSCNAACSTNNMSFTMCSGGNCSGTCNPGFADCNGNLRADGCEVDTNTDPNHCGGCNNACGGPSECESSVTCENGRCKRNPKPNGSTCSGGTCCNGHCCGAGKTCCGSGANFGCCAGGCCGGVCCEFPNSKCCNGLCYVGVTPPC